METMLGLINNLKIKSNLQVQYLHCDNAGENQAFKKTCKQEGLGINFQYTAPGMPQQNGCIPMLNGGKFTPYLQSGLWAEAANTATILENHLITPNRTLSPFQQFFGKGKKSVLNSMQKFGETCIITYKDNTHQAILVNRGIPGI